MTSYLEIAMFSRGVRVVAGANDAPILQHDPLGRDKRTRVPVNWWLMPDDNLLTVRVEPLPGLHSSPMLDIAVAFPEDDEPPLCRVGWGFPEAVDFAPFELRLPFYPPRSARSRVWTEAEVLEALTPAHRKGALDVARELHAAFASRDMNAIMALLEDRMAEMALAFEMDPSTYRAGVRDDMEGLVQGPGFAMEPLDADTVQIRPCCGGRIFHLARAGGGPLVTTLPTESAASTTMQVYVARILGKWRIVRA